MSNAPNKVQFIDSFSVSAAYPLVINNVQVPGGIVKGFALLKIGQYTPQSKQILSAYANETYAGAGNFRFTYYDSTGQILTESTVSYSGYGYEYDASAQTLTLRPQNGGYHEGGYYFNGNYVLFIW